MRSRWITAAIASGASALLLGGLVLAAGTDSPSYPGTYRGTTATGGKVELRVSADGTRVTRFRVTKVPDTCGKLFSGAVDVPVPIVGGRFSNGRPNAGPEFRGSFPASRRARGTVTFRIVNVRDDGCRPKTVRWTATTPARPPVVSYRREGGIAGGAGPSLVVSRDRRATLTDGVCKARFTLKLGAWNRLREALRNADLPTIAGDYPAQDGAADMFTYTIEAGGDTVRITDVVRQEHEEVMQSLRPLFDALNRTVLIGTRRMPPSCTAQATTR
jgi:hypothetical protein